MCIFAYKLNKNIDMTGKKLKHILLKTLITLTLLFLLSNSISEENYNKPKPQIIETEEIMSLTPVNVYKKIIEYKIEYPKIVFSQVMVETGQLKSQGARIKNNLFGFNNKTGHMEFDTWEQSIAYYKEWQDKKYFGGNYHNFLKKVGYAKDSMYISKLILMESKLFKNSIYGVD
jgi:hypothetical protein